MNFNFITKKALREIYSKGFCHKGKTILKCGRQNGRQKQGFLSKNLIFDCIKLSNIQKNRAFIRSFRINTRFWCGRQVSALWAERRNADKLRASSTRSFTDVSRVHLHIIMRFARLSTTKQKRKPRKRFPFLWCGRQELNLHGVTHKILSLARLPVPPRPR